MPPMQSMFGGMRAAGQDTKPLVDKSKDPSTESEDPSTEKEVRVYPDPSTGVAGAPVDVHRYRNGKLVGGLGPRPTRTSRTYVPIPRTHPVDRTYKEPGQGYAEIRAHIDTLKNLERKY